MSTKTIGIIGAVIVAILLLPLVLGGNKVTIANYEKVQMGMSYEEVKKILGKGMDAEEAAEKMKDMDFDVPAAADFKMPEMPAMPEGSKMPDMSKMPDISDMPEGFKMPDMSDMAEGFKMPDMSDMPGMDWLAKLMTMEVYTWTKGDDKVISLGISKDRVVMKSQAGLYDRPTMDMEGMGSIL